MGKKLRIQLLGITTPITSSITQTQTPSPRRRLKKPRNFHPLKHITKGKQAKTKQTKKTKTTAMQDNPQNPENTTSADPD